jgi:hypothetical protein
MDEGRSIAPVYLVRDRFEDAVMSRRAAVVADEGDSEN